MAGGTRRIRTRRCTMPWPMQNGIRRSAKREHAVVMRCIASVRTSRLGVFGLIYWPVKSPSYVRDCVEQGWEIWRIDARMTEHDARMLRFGQWWRRSSRGGYGYAQVWNVTRKLYGRQLASAFAWALLLPLIVIAITIVVGSPWLLAAIPIAFAVQIARISTKMPDDRPRRLGRAALTFLAKIPETTGAIRYFLNAARPSMGSRS